MGKVRADGRIYICKTADGWFRLYRQGQRSWSGVCIVPKPVESNVNYLENEGVSIHGNASDIASKLEDIIGGEVEWHVLWNEIEYRKCLMAIVATGRIDGEIRIEIGEEL